MERFTKENSLNIRTIFEAGTDTKLPKHNVMKPQKILSIVVAAMVLLAGSGTVLASTTTFGIILGGTKVDLEWEPVEPSNIDAFVEKYSVEKGRICTDPYEIDKLLGIRFIKSDSFIVDQAIAVAVEARGEVLYDTTLYLDGKGIALEAKVVLPGYEHLDHGYGVTKLGGLTKYKYAPDKTAYIISDYGSADSDVVESRSYVIYFAHESIMYQLYISRSYGLEFAKTVIDLLTSSDYTPGEFPQYSYTYYAEDPAVRLDFDYSEHAKDDPPLSDTSARVILYNGSDSDIELDLNYIVKRAGSMGQIGGIKDEDRRPASMITIKSGEQYKMKIDWSDIYGPLDRPGTYNIIFFYEKDGKQFLAARDFGFGIKP